MSTYLEGTATAEKPVTKTYPDLRNKLNQRLAQLYSDRERYRAHWRDLQCYMLPEHGFGLTGGTPFEQVDGGKKRQYIIDEEATFSIRILAAGMQSGLTSPSRPWFRLGLSDPTLMDFQPVKVWLSYVEDLMRYVFNRSNTYRALHQGYSELGVFGTWSMLVEEDFDTVIRCRPFTVGEYYLGLNAKLLVDTFYRTAWMNAAQMVEEFGEENCSLAVQKAYEERQLAILYEIVQAIEPNDDTLKLSVDKTYRSVYYERKGDDDGKMLRVNGYEEFPVMTPRWMTIAGKTYGSSCGMDMLPCVKMLQRIAAKQLENLDKMMEPPVVAPGAMKNEVINSLPSGVSYDDTPGGTQGLRPLYQVPDALNASLKIIEGLHQKIRTGFFSDLFLMLSQEPTRSNVTATEIAERHEEKLTVLGPVLESLQSELYDPLIDRTFAIMLRLGMIPPPPPEIQGKALHVEYISVLAQAQKLVNVTGLQQVSGFVAQLAAFKPETLDLLNSDELIKLYADSVGTSPRILNDDRVVAMIRAARAKQQAMQQALAAAPVAADSAKKLSETNLDGNSALAALTGRMSPSPVPAAT